MEPEHGRLSPHPPPAALCVRAGQPRQGGCAQCRRRHHRSRHGQSGPAGARPCGREAEGDHRQAAHRPLFVLARHRRAAPRAGGLLRAPLRREAQSRHPDRRHARLQGRLRQRGAGDHRARRRGAGAESELSDPRLRLPDGGRRDPLGAVRADAGFLRDPGARDRAFDPEADRGGGLLSGESDRLCRRSRFLQGARRRSRRSTRS